MQQTLSVTDVGRGESDIYAGNIFQQGLPFKFMATLGVCLS